MQLEAFSPTSDLKTVAATVANTAQAMGTVPVSPANILRVVNEATTTAFISFGGDSTTDVKRLPVLGSTERLFMLPMGITTVGCCLASGTGNVYLQVGNGN